MVNAYIENSYKLVFPLLCSGYLNLDYDMAITQNSAKESTGVLVNGAISDNSTTTIAVDTVDATTKFEIGDTVFDAADASVGTVSAVTATQITLAANNDEALADNENLKKHVTTIADARNRNIWEHDDSFVIEALITPYDVNGIGSRTAGRHGVLTSEKTAPYPSDDYGSRATNYESVDYLGASAYLTQKMMLFNNQYVKFYLQNTTSSSYNQPAEYKIVAELTESGGSSKTVSTDAAVITAHSRLYNYYDPDGYYDDNSTAYTKVSTSATGSNPSGTITISDYSDLETNTKSTGQIVVSGDIANYTSPVAATTTFTFATNNVPRNTPPTYATAIVAVNALMTGGYNAGNGPLASDYVEIKDSGGTSVKFYQFVNGSQPDGRSSGTSLVGYSDSAGTEYGDTSYLYLDTDNSGVAASTTTAATSLTTAINAARTAGSLDINAATSSGKTVSLVSAATTPANHNNDQNGIGTGTWVTTAGPSSGAAYSVAGWGASYGSPTQTNGVNEVVDDEYLTIISTDGTTKRYRASSNSARPTGTLYTGDDGVQCVIYQVGANSGETACGLRTAINHSNGHNGKITASCSNAGSTTTLVQATVGADGNKTVTRTAGITNSHVSIANFTGGVTEANATSTPYIQIIDNESSPTTKKYVPVASTDAITTGSNNSGSIGDVTGGIAFREGGSVSATADNLRTAIAHSNGHNGTILTDSAGSATINLTQNKIGANTTAITLTNLPSNISKTNFSGGATPDNHVSIRDAAGTLKKYKASIHETTGTTDGTYTFFKAETSNNATAANLETAIDGANGHNGTIITTTASNVVTAKLNQAAMGSAAMSDDVTDLVATNFTGSTTDEINVGSGEASEIGAGNKIYASDLTLLGTVSSVSGNVITLTSAPTSTVTSTVYTEQLREALYLEQMFKISLVFKKGGIIELWLNDTVVKRDTHTLNSVTLHPSDCKIGRGANDAEQFFGELYEIAFHKGKRPCSTINTLTPSYSDILFYYAFRGD